jgi:excisionase family DNA binding protein
VELKKNLDLTEPLCISVPAAARMLGVSRNTGYEMARLGQLPTIKCGRRRLVVPKAALMKMLQEANEPYEKGGN